MCGICGKVDLTGNPVPEALIDRMCATMVHRGPDAQGIHVGPRIGLGQRRLAVIDLSADAVAPLPNEDESVWVTFNGEIYNFVELRVQLEARGHRFRTRTDTEVLVHLYEDFGADCVHHLRGMFAFAIWDSGRRVLVAARDRFGKKPFCYARFRGGLVFGSTIAAVLAEGSTPRRPDFAALDAYLTNQYVPSPRTAFEGISKLPAAHYLTYDQYGQLSVQRYWQPPIAAKSAQPAPELAEELLRLLREAVRRRLVADVPLGAFLSGGIDSASVVALMAEQMGGRAKTFSIGFEDFAFNELGYARAIAARFGTEHHEFVVNPDALELLPQLVRHYNEPFADSSALPTFCVSRVTREQVTVALSGDGGDEAFGGYENYGTINSWAAYDSVPRAVRQLVARGVSAVLDPLPFSNPSARAMRGASMWAGALPDRVALQSAIFKPEEKEASYTPHFRTLIEEASPAVALEPEWNETMDALDWMIRYDQQRYLPDCLMVKTDVASMAVGLEVRCPFLDQDIIEFAATVPSSLKRSGAVGKRILRDAVKPLLPESILTKPKTGFGVPIARWFRGELADLLRRTLGSESFARRRLFHQPFVARMMAEHRSGERDWSSRLWALVMLELWFREFID